MSESSGFDNFAASKDVIFGFTYDQTVVGNLSFAAFKMGTNGQVTKVASQVLIGPKDGRVHNNGEWMGYQTNLDNYLRLFRLDANNQIVDLTTLKEAAVLYYLLADNSLVYYDLKAFQTLLYTGNGQWTPLSGRNITVELTGAFPNFPAFATNNTLFYRNSTGTVHVYSRTNDGAWKFESTFNDDLGLAVIGYNYNGVDTIVTVNSVNIAPGKQ